jgi:hypothetical protein
MSILNVKRLLVVLCFATMAVAALVTPMPEADPNWGNTMVAAASIGYLMSLVMIALDISTARYLFLPSLLISLIGMPIASYPSGELNAFYDLTMYISGFLNGGLAILVYAPASSSDEP